MRIIGLVNAFNEEQLVGRCLRNIYPYVDRIVISCTDWPTGKRIPEDGTLDVINDFLSNTDKSNKCYLLESQVLQSQNPRINEGTLKTRMMKAAKPEEGDWIWIVEADEFYLAHQLKGLKGRLLLGHKSVSEHNRHWLTVSSCEFAYNTFWCHYGYHGRFFRYRPGSKFTISNHFHWPNEEISQDKHRWHIPICHLQMFHMKYVKPLERIKNRSILNTNPEGDEGYANWFNNTFKVWPRNPIRAHRNNPGGGWVKSSGLQLFKYKGQIPEELCDYDLDLMEELK